MARTPGKRLTYDRVAERRDFIKTLWRTRVSERDSIRILEEEGFFEGYSESYGARRTVYYKDLRIVKEAAKKSHKFDITPENVEKARKSYIASMLEIFTAAFQAGDFTNAVKAAKSIAHAFGIPTEEPIVLEHKGTVEHVHSIVGLIREYDSDNRIVKELDAVVID